MKWPRLWPARRREERSSLLSIGDPAVARLFNVGAPNYSGVEVGESSALAVSAVWRSVALIAGTLAQLPLPTMRDTGDGMSQRVTSFLDDPGGPEGPTPFSWKETVFAHMLLHGDAFLAHELNGAGAIAALVPLHPQCVSVRWRRPDEPGPGRKVYTATLENVGQREFDITNLTQVSGLSLNGLRGMSVISAARNSIGTAIAGDRAAANMFGNGAMISGMVTPEEDVTSEEADAIAAQLDRSVNGWENAGTIPVINRKLKFQPWTMSAEDAQFLQSRQFQTEEIARWFGIPPHLLGMTEKTTSWGAGIEVQNRGLGRTVLAPWGTRLEQPLSRLLSNPRFVQFDFAALERPTPETEIDMLIKQVDAGLMTPNEARAIRGLAPLPGGDVLRTAASAGTASAGVQPALEAVPA